MERLENSGASRHVYNGMSLLWDVVEREEPILLRLLSGKIEVYVTGTVKLECKNKEEESVVLNLYNTLFIPQAKVCLFSL